MIKCNFCGKEFEPTPYKRRQFSKGVPVYCSTSCATSFRYKDKLEITNELIQKVRNMFNNTELPYDEIQKLSGLSKDRFTKMIKENNIKRDKSLVNALRYKHLKQTMQKEYGVSNSMENQEFVDKIKDTKQRRYGSANYNNIEKIKDTKQRRYGSATYNNSEQTKQTNLNNIGKTTYLITNDVKEKRKQTSIERYGVDNPFKSNETHKKAIETIQNKYGVNSTLIVPEIQEKIKKTIIKRYGTTNVFKNDNIKQKQFNTIKQKYGVNYACQLEQCANATPKTHSKPNERYTKLLKPEQVEIPLDRYRYDMLKNNTLIEINPTHTHNSFTSPYNQPKDKYYHLNKTNIAIANNYNCIHIFDWDNWEKIKYMLQDKETLYARNLEIKEVSLEDTAEFLNNYHLQDNCRGQMIRYGLFKGNSLVEIMTFGKPRYNKNYEWELLRLCSHKDYKIVGGAEKLFKHFLEIHKPTSIISYCDYSKFSGDVYTRLGFEQKGKIEPSKHWSKGTEHITDNLLRQRGYDQLFNANYGKGTSNEQLMLENGWLPVYDCGQITFVWKTK